MKGNDLVITVYATRDSVTINDWGTLLDAKNFTLESASGAKLHYTQINQIVEAMAAQIMPELGSQALPQGLSQLYTQLAVI